MKMICFVINFLHIIFANLIFTFFFMLLFPFVLLVFFFRLMRVLSFSEGSSILAIFPGSIGIIFRRIWYKYNLKSCGRNIHVGWMSVIRNLESEIGDDVSIGPFSCICRAHIGDDTMVSGNCYIISGMHQHHIKRLDIPIRMQGCSYEIISIGNDCWIGVGSIVMANIAPGSVVAAGSVINNTFEPYLKLAGVPARIIGSRKNESITDVDCTE